MKTGILLIIVMTSAFLTGYTYALETHKQKTITHYLESRYHDTLYFIPKGTWRMGEVDSFITNSRKTTKK
jgi:hypothetical protein